jgi:hypothetical protein
MSFAALSKPSKGIECNKKLPPIYRQIKSDPNTRTSADTPPSSLLRELELEHLEDMKKVQCIKSGYSL